LLYCGSSFKIHFKVTQDFFPQSKQAIRNYLGKCFLQVFGPYTQNTQIFPAGGFIKRIKPEEQWPCYFPLLHSVEKHLVWWILAT
jgi:hypothetical protein